jgi:hypothetical protein
MKNIFIPKWSQRGSDTEWSENQDRAWIQKGTLDAPPHACLFLTIALLCYCSLPSVWIAESTEHVQMGSPSHRRHRWFTRAGIHVCHDAPKELDDMHIIVQLAHHSASSKQNASPVIFRVA